MKPYFVTPDGSMTLYHADCLDVLPTLERGSVDLLLTDPPYGIEWQSGMRRVAFDLIAGDDGSLDVPAVIGVALPALRRGRHLYIFGRFDLSCLPVSAPVELIWDKEIQSGGNTQGPWGMQHEYIQFAVYWPSKQDREDGRGRLSARLRQGSVLRCARLHGMAVNRHPTEKPVPILRQMIESSTVYGEMVLDPFAGSGSTLVAARLEGRRAIGIEIDERYCDVAAKRLSQQVLPIEMEAS